MSKDSSGPAYPFEYHNQTGSHQPGFFDSGMLSPGASQQFAGMSLRDYFAASALSGLTANPKFNPIKQPVQCAQDAYTIADAMLAARSA